MDSPIPGKCGNIYRCIIPLPPVANIALRLVDSEVQCGRFYSKYRTKSTKDFKTQSHWGWCEVWVIRYRVDTKKNIETSFPTNPIRIWIGTIVLSHIFVVVFILSFIWLIVVLLHGTLSLRIEGPHSCEHVCVRVGMWINTFYSYLARA